MTNTSMPQLSPRLVLHTDTSRHTDCGLGSHLRGHGGKWVPVVPRRLPVRAALPAERK
jgi:hypothetical protein